MKVTLVLIAAMFTLSQTGCSKASKKQGDAAKVEDAKKMTKTKAEMSAPKAGTIECKLGTDVRQIEVKSVGSGCEVEYTKFGSSNVVANAQHELGHCSRVAERIKGKLQGHGFTCN